MTNSLDDIKPWAISAAGGAGAGTLVSACWVVTHSHHFREVRTLVDAGLPAGIGAVVFGMTLAFVAKRKGIDVKTALGLLLPWAALCLACVASEAAVWSAFGPTASQRTALIAQLASKGIREDGYWVWFDVRRATAGALWAVMGAALATVRMVRSLGRLYPRGS